MNNKKGSFGQLVSLVTAVAIMAVVLMATFLVLAQGTSQIEAVEGAGTASSNYNASVAISSAVADIPDWMPIVIITGIGISLIGLVALFKRTY